MAKKRFRPRPQGGGGSGGYRSDRNGGGYNSGGYGSGGAGYGYGQSQGGYGQGGSGGTGGRPGMARSRRRRFYGDKDFNDRGYRDHGYGNYPADNGGPVGPPLPPPPPQLDADGQPIPLPEGAAPPFESQPEPPLEQFVGLLELHPNGYGFLRSPANNYSREKTDPFVPAILIERFRLREGLMCRATILQSRRQQGPRVKEILFVEGMAP
jgi:transcription termination factor Rho